MNKAQRRAKYFRVLELDKTGSGMERLNPRNPLVYLLLIFGITVYIVGSPFIAIWETTQLFIYHNPFKWHRP